jgi:ATP-dependent Clp protease ATP-binding subunit ClpA
MSITRRLCVFVLFITLLVDPITKGFSWTWTPKSTVGKRYQNAMPLNHIPRSFSTILSREQRIPRISTSSSSTAISMVFERMSEDCILALMTAQAETKKLGLSEVTNEVLLAGIVDHPEQAKPTLVQYGITLRKITQTLRTIYSTTATSTASASPFSMFLVQQQQQKQSTEDIPFSKPVQRTLQSASQLANHMTSPTIRSQHILLALMDYSTTSDASSGGDTKRQGSASNPTGKTTGAIRVLQLMDERTTFSVHEFSQTLVQSMQDQQQKEEASTSKKEGVLAGGSETSNTPTLQDCGIDLTQQARAGLLDPVHGRDDEIRSSLRTLVRRRKNNPCLIGGK